MDNQQVSKLRLYSLGIVAANKALNSNIVEVTPIEQMPMLDGEISSDQTTSTVQSTDASGTSYQTNVASSNSLKATWLPIGNGNRKTSPDVRRGATVMLYQFGDADKYYWSTLQDDLNLRKLETVVYAFSATQNEASTSDADSTYFLEVSTHKKLITFHTSKANGEPFGYDIQINTAEGYIKIQDDAGNWFTFDSQEHQIAMKNVDGAYIDLNKTNFTINVPDTVTITCKDFVNNASNSISETTKTITVSADTESIKATTTHTGNTTHIGNIALQGDLSTTGGGGGTGKVSIGSDVNVSGSSTLKDVTAGTVNAQKLSSPSPVSAPGFG